VIVPEKGIPRHGARLDLLLLQEKETTPSPAFPRTDVRTGSEHLPDQTNQLAGLIFHVDQEKVARNGLSSPQPGKRDSRGR